MKAKPSTGQSDGIDFPPLGYYGSHSAATTAGRSVDLVQFVLAHWTRLAMGFAGGMALGAVFYLFSGPRYDASTRILVSKLAGTPLQEGEATTYGDRAEHVELIRSDVIVRRAFELGQLDRLPTLAGADTPIRDVIEALKVKRTAGQDQSFLNLLDISYQSPSRQDAATVVAAVVDAYGEYLAATREQQSQEVLRLIRDAEDKLHREIEALKKEYQVFRKSAPLLFHNPPGDPSATGSVTSTPPNHYLAAVDQLYAEQRNNQQRRTRLQAQIDVLTAMQEEGESSRTIEQYVLMSMAQHGAGGGSGGGASNPLLAVNPAKDRLDARLLEARIQEVNLTHHLGAQHPEVEKLRRAIEGIREAYAAEGLQPPAFDHFERPADGEGPHSGGVDLAAIYRTFLEEQLRQLDLSDRSIERQLDEAIALAKEHAEYEMMDRQLSDELRRKQALWDGIVSKLSLVDFTKDQTGYRMTRISDVLVELSIKRMIKILGGFGMVGALCLFSLQYFREWRDTSLRSLEELRQFTDATVLGIVPRFAVDPRAESLNTGLSRSLLLHHRPGSREAEAYRSLRTTLLLCGANNEDRVIQLSSPEPGDGKSTSAANLAIAVANAGRRVLLIDADLRRPSIHHLFGLPQQVGLSDVLRREIDWINAVKPTAIEGLSVLTSGQCPDNPAELLSAAGLPALMQEARREFDYVFIDSPPLLGVSDPCILSLHVDGLLLVVRLHKNSRASVERAIDILQAHGAALHGIIANDVDGAVDFVQDVSASAVDRCAAASGGMEAAHAGRSIPVE